MARRLSKHLRQARPLGGGHASATVKRDGRWIVRGIPGAAAAKTYRCPGCQQLIPPATPHVVAWPAEPGQHADRGVEDRRHWHTSCWERRL